MGFCFARQFSHSKVNRAYWLINEEIAAFEAMKVLENVDAAFDLFDLRLILTVNQRILRCPDVMSNLIQSQDLM